jgi:predicted nucleotidyltransferase component of viral defense system
MLIQDLKEIAKNGEGKNQFYIRNLVKEEVQNYILNFIYQDSEYQNLIFTGGTCLRKLYGIDRLSEDLDFDYISKFDIDKFAVKLKNYFASKLQYKEAETKISGNRQTLFLKFPSEDIFVRCDFSKIAGKIYGLNKGMITAGKFRFLVNAYDLETMFTNKIMAFLRRNFYKGKFQTIPFKGRDIYDIFWLLQLSAKSGYRLKPNQKRLVELTGSDLSTLRQEIKDKIKKVKAKFVYEDLLPLVESDIFLRGFLKAFNTNIVKQIEMVI